MYIRIDLWYKPSYHCTFRDLYVFFILKLDQGNIIVRRKRASRLLSYSNPYQFEEIDCDIKPDSMLVVKLSV